MTLFQETASARKPLNSDPTLSSPFQAMLAGLVVLLMAVAVTSFVVDGHPTGTSAENELDAAYANGYPLHGGLAGPSRVGINDAGSFAPGYPLHGGLAGPSRVTIDSAGGFAAGSLRFAPQPAEGATDGDNQRFVNVD
jgi:hypothetical protein